MTVLHKPYCSQTIFTINDPLVFRFSSLFKKKTIVFHKSGNDSFLWRHYNVHKSKFNISIE